MPYKHFLGMGKSPKFLERARSFITPLFCFVFTWSLHIMKRSSSDLSLSIQRLPCTKGKQPTKRDRSTFFSSPSCTLICIMTELFVAVFVPPPPHWPLSKPFLAWLHCKSIHSMCRNKSDSWRPHWASDLALTRRGMDTGALGVSRRVWH